MRVFILIAVLVALTGCNATSGPFFTNAGQTHYTYETTSLVPVKGPDGVVVMVEEKKSISVYDTKDEEAVSASFSKDESGNLVAKITKKGVNASAPMTAISEAMKSQSEALKSVVEALRK